MKKIFMLPLALLVCIAPAASLVVAQEKTASSAAATPAPVPENSKGDTGKSAIVITATTSPMDLARAAYVAWGGDKFRKLQSVVLTGSVDLYAPNSVQSMAGKFVLVTAGERSRLEIQSPVFNYRQISDGEQTYSSVRGMELPAPNKFGINVLMKYDQPGYVVSAVPDNKKLRAFRITTPDGQSTDFFIDPTTAKVASYLIPYNGYMFGVENKVLKEVDGVLIPYSFVQRLETPQGAFFAEYKVKDVKLDQPVADDVFEFPKQ